MLAGLPRDGRGAGGRTIRGGSSASSDQPGDPVDGKPDRRRDSPLRSRRPPRPGVPGLLHDVRVHGAGHPPALVRARNGDPRGGGRRPRAAGRVGADSALDLRPALARVVGALLHVGGHRARLDLGYLADHPGRAGPDRRRCDRSHRAGGSGTAGRLLRGHGVVPAHPGHGPGGRHHEPRSHAGPARKLPPPERDGGLSRARPPDDRHAGAPASVEGGRARRRSRDADPLDR